MTQSIRPVAEIDSTTMEMNCRWLGYHGGVTLQSDIALIAGLMGEPARAAILAALVDGRALPAGELAFLSNVAPPTASFHLRKLLEASLIAVEKQGKHSYYRLADDSVAAALESLAALAPMGHPTEPRKSRDNELRFARTCYKHLAGVLAVAIHGALLERGFLIAEPERGYSLTSAGQQWAAGLGINLPPSACFGRACIDWTERRHHLGGPLGSALLSGFKTLRWIVPTPGKRTVRVTHSGAAELEKMLGIVVSR